MIDIIFNDLYCEDIIDDFEEFGRCEGNFTLSEFIQDDFSRAFCLGYCYEQIIKQKLWIPVSIRKEIRHLPEELEYFNPQLKWLNDKYNVKGIIKIQEYAKFILNNVFCDDKDTLLKLAVILGINFNKAQNKTMNEST